MSDNRQTLVPGTELLRAHLTRVAISALSSSTLRESAFVEMAALRKLC